MYVYAYWLIVIWNVAELCIGNIPVYMSLAERRQTMKDRVIIFKIIIAAIGVKRSQICKLESGKCSITISTMGKVFHALGITTATFDLGVEGKVALW